MRHRGTMKVSIPRTARGWDRVAGSGVKASIGMLLRSRESRRAESPVWVKVTMNFAPTSSAISAAATVTAPPMVRTAVPIDAMRDSPWSSVFSMIRAIVRTDSIGHFPIEVSPRA